MKKIKLTDEVVLPLMLMHDIPREEAEKRLYLLGESSILKTGHPGDPETQRLIDSFLAVGSEEMSASVLFDKTLSECIENKDFVKEYDRLRGKNFTEIIRQSGAGHPPKNAEKEFNQFAKFVKNYVFQRMASEGQEG